MSSIERWKYEKLSSILSQLFGEDEDSGNENELDEAEKQGENGRKHV